MMLFALLTLACNPGDTTMDDQLEPVAYTITRPDGVDGWQELELEETVAVAGSDRDYTFTASNEAGDWSIAFHTPGQTDLARLDGEHLTLSFPNEESYAYGGQGLVLFEDEDGPLYLANMAGSAPDAADAVMGAGFVTWGERIGKEDVPADEDPTESDLHDYYSALVQIDEGAVEVMPGEALHLVLDGQTWRFVLVAAFKINDRGGLFGKCIEAPDVLSFEMLRVTDGGEDTVIMRPEGVAGVTVEGC